MALSLINQKNSKPKVACFLFDPRVGGPTVRVKSVYRQIHNSQYETIVVFAKEDIGASFIREGGIETAIVPTAKPVSPKNFWAFLNYFVRLPHGVLRVRRFLKENNVNVVHANGVYDLVPVIGGRFAGVKVLWHLNDAVFPRKISRILGKMVKALASQIAVSSHFVADHFGLSTSSVERLFVPVDLDRFPDRGARETPDFSSQRQMVIGHLANWNPLKGQDKLVQAMELLIINKGHKAVRAKFIGGLLDTQVDYWKRITEQIDESELSNFIDVVGFEKDVPKALKGIDILVITSKNESGPIACVEAMANGIPIVSFPVGDVATMIGDGEVDCAGIIVPHGDVKILNSAIESLLNDSQRYREYSINASRRAEANYSAIRAAEMHNNLYCRMMDLV